MTLQSTVRHVVYFRHYTQQRLVYHSKVKNQSSIGAFLDIVPSKGSMLVSCAQFLHGNTHIHRDATTVQQDRLFIFDDVSKGRLYRR